MVLIPLVQFLAHAQADYVSLLAQAFEYSVSGNELLRFSCRSPAGVRLWCVAITLRNNPAATLDHQPAA